MLNQEIENMYNEYKMELDSLENKLKDLWYSVPIIIKDIDYYMKKNQNILNDILEQCNILNDNLLILFPKIRNMINEYYDNYYSPNFDKKINSYNNFYKNYNRYDDLWVRCRHCFPVFCAIRKTILELDQMS